MERTPIDKFVEELTSTRAFRRLGRISFLGIVDREINRDNPRVRTFTRADHSQGVLRLAEHIISLAKLSTDDAYHLVAAALLHDIAHPAFSHSLEYAFSNSQRDLDHHEALRLMLLYDLPFSRDLHRVLRYAGVYPERLISIIDGSDRLNYLFSAPPNIDTLDGIRRSFLSIGALATYRDPILLHILSETFLGNSVSDPDLLSAADVFWQHKGEFYEKFLPSRIANAERDFQRLVRERIPTLRADYFFIGDDEFVLRYPEIFQSLRELSRIRPRTEGGIADQKFVIDRSVTHLDKRTIFLRYRRLRAPKRAPSFQAAIS